MSLSEKILDLLAIGRSSVDLYGEQVGGRLEDMSSFAKYIGGSPTNTAVGLARLGLKSALLTRVGADHMGRFIREQLERERVDVSSVRTDADRPTALVILGIRDSDTFPLIFYRENCADMAIGPEDVDVAQAQSARAILINGTHLSTRTVFDASMKAVGLARASGGKVVFDIDYRPVLWGLAPRDMGEDRFVAHESVTKTLQEVLPQCDLVVGTEEEYHILGGTTDTIASLCAVRDRTDALLVCKRGPLGCCAFPGPIPERMDQGISGNGFEVEVFNVLGAGDAFMAGFLRGWIEGMPLERCCELGNAAGAIVVSRHGCAPAMPTWPELDAFLRERDRPFRLRDDAELEHLHWATTRSASWEELAVLAVDHRTQFEELAAEANAHPRRIEAFKALALEALQQVAQGDRRFGILLDGQYGSQALARAADFPYWIGRCIEIPRSRPVEFACSADVGMELATWPVNHVVKVLVIAHPDDEPSLRERQDRQVLRLFDACRKTRHELLLEVIVPGTTPADARTIAHTMDHFYDIGVRPDWWKLQPVGDPASWQSVERVITRRDPLCRGILVLGLSQPVDALVASFKATGACKYVRGFAVGRTIFHDPARAWLKGEINDVKAISELAIRLRFLCDGWRNARAKAEELT